MSITIDKNVYTSINIKISEEIDFTYIKKIIFTIKNNCKDKPVLVVDLYNPGEHNIEITPEQSKLIKESAVYDFDLETIDNKRYKITDNDKIIIREGVGNSYD